MTGYICIAMLEDPPYNLILATTEDEPEVWLAKLPLPSHLILYESFQDVQEIKRQCIKVLKAEGIPATSNKAFSAQIHEVLRAYQLVRDRVKFGESSDHNFEKQNEANIRFQAKKHSFDKNKPRSEADEYFELAEQYYAGDGVELDREKAKEFYIKAAGNGHVEAQYKLGNIYSNLLWSNNYIHDDPYRQFEFWYRLAAEQGHVAAQSSMMFWAGTIKEAKSWHNKIRKAAEQGNADAQYELGDDYSLGRSESSGFNVEEDEELAKFWYLKAAKSYTKVAEQGDPIAQFKLAGMYSRGKGLESNDEEAVFWFRKAAEQGHRDSIYRMGYHYERGYGVAKNAEEAARWYRQAAEKGDATAQYDLFKMYSKGRGVKQDFVQAADWCHKAAAERDSLPAMIQLASLYLEGRGLERSEKLADFWLKKAAKREHSVYWREDCFKEIAKTAFDRTIRLSPGILFRWAEFYAKGNVLPQDDEKALFWYRKAADRGYAPAQCLLAAMYLNGAGVEKDDWQALSWFKIAAEQGDATGQYNLAVMCFKGRGIIQDKEQGILWCKKAASQGHQAAQEALKKTGVDWI